MQWIHNYDLILFDFDGLLVDTEYLHFTAYKQVLQAHDIAMNWEFSKYCLLAHSGAETVKFALYEEFSKLREIDLTWEELYAQKKITILNLLKEKGAALMPGVAPLLENIHRSSVNCCVVTHSPQELVDIVKTQHPLVNAIPNWITRSDYLRPKPDPECYFKAISTYAAKGARIIGFEDTPRGLQALIDAKVEAVLITSISYPQVESLISQGAVCYDSFLAFMKASIAQDSPLP